MAAKRLKWSSLLNLTELQFEPEAPKQLMVSDELSIAISWLTGATKHDRKLLRCDENGALLIAEAWSLFNVSQNDELVIDTGSFDTSIDFTENKGVLCATSTELVKITFQRTEGGSLEAVYVPPETLYWYPHNTFRVVGTCVPADTGSVSLIGLTTFK